MNQDIDQDYLDSEENQLRVPLGNQKDQQQSSKISEFLEDNVRFFEKHYQNRDQVNQSLAPVFQQSSFFVINQEQQTKQYSAEDFLYIDSGCQQKHLYRIKCLQNDLILHPKKKLLEQQIISSEELFGARVIKLKENLSKIDIILSKFVPKSCCTDSNRKQKTITLYHPDHDKLIIWKNLIHYVAAYTKFVEQHSRALSEKRLQPFYGAFLVFINPHSGPGKAPEIWKKTKEQLTLAGFEFSEIFTERRNHAQDFLLEIDQDKLLCYKGILTVSGDGLPHEVINALFKRKDSHQILKKLPIGSIPAGSGNALTTSVCKDSEQPDTLEGMIYLIAKGKFKEMDAIKVDIDTLEDPIYSFLSINFGFIADVDINSEFMRCLGELRFELYGIYRAICQKNYRAKIWTSTDQNTVLPEINEPIEGMEDKIFRLFIMHNMAYLSKSYMSAPLCKIDDGYIDYQALEDTGYCKLIKVGLDFQSGKHFDLEKQTVKPEYGLTYARIKAFRLQIDANEPPALFSIDGENYKARIVQGKIIKRCFTVFANNQDQDLFSFIESEQFSHSNQNNQ